ncbi:hypothetical protein MalM14_23400 [Gimesia chilikensis]|nr:hypothetical protein MalM14_23400 [Gimesia chilikensis]
MGVVWLSWDLLLPAAIPDFIRDHPWVVRGMGFVAGWWVGCLINYRRLAPCRSEYLVSWLIDYGCHGAYGGGGAVAEGVFFQEFLDVVQ